MQETRVQSLSREDPLEKEMAAHSSTLAWKIPWMEEPGRLQPMGSQRVGHDWVTSLSLSWRPTRPFRTNTQKRCPFHYRGLEWKSRKSRDTWSNRQMWPWTTEWSRAKANRVLPRECTGHINTLFQQTREDYTWTSPDGQYHNQTDYVLCSQRWKSSIQSTKTRPGADCGSDHELLIAKFRFKLKKVGKTTRILRYDLNQIPYDYTVEVRNRFKGLIW